MTVRLHAAAVSSASMMPATRQKVAVIAAIRAAMTRAHLTPDQRCNEADDPDTRDRVLPAFTETRLNTNRDRIYVATMMAAAYWPPKGGSQ